MPVYDVTLQGYDGSGRPESEDLVKWVKAPSPEAVMAFLGEIPLHEPPREMPEYPLIDYQDGVDIKLSKSGVLLGVNPSYGFRRTRGILGKRYVLARWRKEIAAAFQDSPKRAKEDQFITVLHYMEGVFRSHFTSPFEQYHKHVGKPFTVLHRIRPSRAESSRHDAEDDMYMIRFADGTEIEAFGHEVCILNYAKCKAITGVKPDYMKD